MFRNKIIVAGAGGQGALRVGQIISAAALNSGYETEFMPSYGAEMRGGTANCNVIVSDYEIPFPMVTAPDYLLVMNEMSLDRFENAVRAGGILIINHSIIKKQASREDIDTYYIPADAIAEEEKNKRGANMVMLGAYLALVGNLPIDSVYGIIDDSFKGAKAKYAESNKRLVTRGYDYIKSYH